MAFPSPDELIAAGCKVVRVGNREIITGPSELLRQLMNVKSPNETMKKSLDAGFEEFMNEIGVK
jgi:hypothetical protein